MNSEIKRVIQTSFGKVVLRLFVEYEIGMGYIWGRKTRCYVAVYGRGKSYFVVGYSHRNPDDKWNFVS